MPCGRHRASAAVSLGQAVPGRPADTAAPPRAPRVAPFRKLRVADAWFTRSAKACATRSFRFAAAPSVVRSPSDGTQDASKTFEVRKPGRSLWLALLHEFGEGRRELRSSGVSQPVVSWRLRRPLRPVYSGCDTCQGDRSHTWNTLPDCRYTGDLTHRCVCSGGVGVVYRRHRWPTTFGQLTAIFMRERINGSA